MGKLVGLRRGEQAERKLTVCGTGRKFSGRRRKEKLLRGGAGERLLGHSGMRAWGERRLEGSEEGVGGMGTAAASWVVEMEVEGAVGARGLEP